jgi:hypothetical protein
MLFIRPRFYTSDNRPANATIKRSTGLAGIALARQDYIREIALTWNQPQVPQSRSRLVAASS